MFASVDRHSLLFGVSGSAIQQCRHLFRNEFLPAKAQVDEESIDEAA
jgi:hypothetical protein